MEPTVEVTIRDAARRAGLHRAHQLGVRARISPGVAARWWKGGVFEKIDLGVLGRICQALSCDIDEVLILRRADQVEGGHVELSA